MCQRLLHSLVEEFNPLGMYTKERFLMIEVAFLTHTLEYVITYKDVPANHYYTMVIPQEVMLVSDIPYNVIASIDTKEKYLQMANALQDVIIEMKSLIKSVNLTVGIIDHKMVELTDSNNFNSLSAQLPAMKEMVLCPRKGEVTKDSIYGSECKAVPNALWNVIQHLNDDHRLTREEIADWVRTLPFDTTFKNPNMDKA